MLVLTVLVTTSTASFALGYLAGGEGRRGSVSAREEPPLTALAEPLATPESVTASKSGTKYYPAGCAGADRISPANKVQFASAAAAISAGYTLAANCK
ncbi:MAG: hypothetical protein WC217_02070 [Candidatus Paceibacterota bacterium]